jgi:hypothetical protein
MTSLKIHRFDNEIWGRCHLPFFRKFSQYLAQYFNVEYINYNKDGNTFSGPINLLSNINNFFKNPPISDVECVIENTQNKELKLLSFTEYFNNYAVHIAKSTQCSTTLLAHFNYHNIYYWLKRDNAVNCINKIKPWIFLPFQEFDFEYYRQKKIEIKQLKDEMFWLGSGVDSYRKMIRIIEKLGFLQKIEPTSHQDYLYKLINSKIAISYYMDLDKYSTPFDHPGELCYRDIEYSLLGIPYIRIEYKDSLYKPLLPNVHYCSISREKAYSIYEKNGDRGIADLYIEKFHEIKNDDLFLKYISDNQILWSNNIFADNNAEKLTFNLLQLDKWI